MNINESTNFSPYYKLNLSSTHSALVGKTETISVDMLVDTGATMCCIPESAIVELEKNLGTGLPIRLIDVRGYDGVVMPHRMYTLTLHSDDNLNSHTMTFVAIPIEKGLLGRNLLNQYTICLDGHKLQWRIFNGGFFSFVIKFIMKLSGKRVLNYKYHKK
jgi:hypothetical protein